MENQDTLAHFSYTYKIISGGFGEAFSLTPDNLFYPPLFHAFAAAIHYVSIIFVSTNLIPCQNFCVAGGISVASSVSIAWILITSIIWPIGVTLFTREVFDRLAFPFKPALFFICPLISLCFPCFPAMQLESGTLYPYTLAAALMPFLLMFFIRFLACIELIYDRAEKSRRRLIITLFELLFVLVLSLLSQPRILFLCALIIIPYFISFIYVIIKRFGNKTRPLIISISVVFALSIVATIIFVIKKMSSSLLSHPENWFKDHGVDMSREFALQSVLTFQSVIPPNFSTGINYVLFGLIVISSLILIFNKIKYEHAHFWIIISLVLSQFVLFIIASGQTIPENLLAAPWYKEFIRIGPALPLLATCIIALGLTYVSARYEWIGYPFLIISICILLINPQIRETKNFIETENNLTNERWSLISQSKIDALSDFKKQIPEDSVVINDPYNGSGYLFSMFEKNVLFETMNPKYGEIPRQWKVIDGFTQSDPKEMQKLVCDSAQPKNGLYFVDLGEAYTTKFSIYKQYLPFHNADNIKKYVSSGVLKIISKSLGGEWTLYKVNC